MTLRTLYLVERCVRLHEGVRMRSTDGDADQLSRHDIAGAVEAAHVRVTRRGKRSIRAL